MIVKGESAKAGLYLNIKKPCITTMEEINSLNTDNEGIRIKDFATMEELRRITKSRGVSLETKAKIIHTLGFPVIMYRCESSTMKKAESKRIDSFDIQCWRRALQIPWTTKKGAN